MVYEAVGHRAQKEALHPRATVAADDDARGMVVGGYPRKHGGRFALGCFEAPAEGVGVELSGGEPPDTSFGFVEEVSEKLFVHTFGSQEIDVADEDDHHLGRTNPGG